MLLGNIKRARTGERWLLEYKVFVFSWMWNVSLFQTCPSIFFERKNSSWMINNRIDWFFRKMDMVLSPAQGAYPHMFYCSTLRDVCSANVVCIHHGLAPHWATTCVWDFHYPKQEIRFLCTFTAASEISTASYDINSYCSEYNYPSESNDNLRKHN